MLSEINQSKIHIVDDSIYMNFLEKRKLYRQKASEQVTGAGIGAWIASDCISNVLG
jgi:adenine-specific DNA methylase